MTTEVRIKAVGKFPARIITANSDGREDHWSFSHSVEPQSEERCVARREDDVAADAEKAEGKGFTVDQTLWTNCQWVTASSWHTGQCGRNAIENRYGLALCWQHEDAVLGHVVERLRHHRYHKRQIDSLAEELLDAEGRLSGIDGPRSTFGVSPIVIDALKTHLKTLVESRFSVDPEIAGLIDEMIEKRLQEKWGA